MKKLNTYHLFLAQYFFWAGVLIGVAGSVIPDGTLLTIGSLMVFVGAVVEMPAMIRLLVMQTDGTAYHASKIRVIIPAPSAVHIRGVFFFVLECTYEDKACKVHAIQSPLMAMPKWSKHIQNGTLAVTPHVRVYAKGSKTLIEAFI